MSKEPAKNEEKIEPATCGIIMPISAMGPYTETHWSEVKAILEEVIDGAGFIPNLVSDANDVGIIHNRIVTNIYDNPVLVCDVSGKNPNVMFELGLRLAFDKPTIIIKDTDTNYSFDTSPIEHLTYPTDLRYKAINDFKLKLKKKIEDTYKAYKTDPDYSTFLKNFIKLKPTLTVKEVDLQEFMQKQFDDLNQRVNTIIKQSSLTTNTGLPSTWFTSHQDIDAVVNVPEPSNVQNLRSIFFEEWAESYTVDIGTTLTNATRQATRAFDAYLNARNMQLSRGEHELFILKIKHLVLRAFGRGKKSATD